MSNKTQLNALATTINACAVNIIGALQTFDNASAVFASEIKQAMQSMVDAATTAGVKKEQEAVTAFGKMVRECETFVDAVAEGMIEGKTVTEYAQGAMRAFYHGTEWTPRTKNDPAMALPWGKAKAPGAKVSTAVGENASAGAKAAETVAMGKALPDAALHELLRTTLKALRARNLNEVAAEVLDACLELEGFKEA